MIDAPQSSTSQTLAPVPPRSNGDPSARGAPLEVPPDPLTTHFKLWALYLVAPGRNLARFRVPR